MTALAAMVRRATLLGRMALLEAKGKRLSDPKELERARAAWLALKVQLDNS